MKKLLSLCLVAVVSLVLSTSFAASAPAPEKSPIVTTYFNTDIDCESCAKKIMSSIPYKKGVKDVNVDIPKKVVTVKFDPEKCTNDDLLKSFTKLKIKASVIKR